VSVQQQLDVGFPLPPALSDEVDLYAYERALCEAGYGPVAGADEVGRGACAGPLVAGAVILPPDLRPTALNDSKLMTPAARDEAYEQIVKEAAWAVAVIPAADVDRMGVQEANYEALRRAVAGLGIRAAFVLFDGFRVPNAGVPSHAVVKGDRLAACISAASVIAKVTRDRIMTGLDETHPNYGFAAHKGYSTAFHQAALQRWGPCAEHRMTYANVAAARALVAETTPLPAQDRVEHTLGRIVGQNGSRSALPVQGALLGPDADAAAKVARDAKEAKEGSADADAGPAEQAQAVQETRGARA
jgi:ribonuclease HII